MSFLNAQIYLNSFSDANSSNAPSLNNVRWCRNLSGLSVQNPTSRQMIIPANQTITLFNKVCPLSQDSTTQYSLEIDPVDGSYSLTWAGGTAPNFRTPRALGTDQTSTVTITMNGPLMGLTGTNVSFTAVVPGDYITLGNVFSPLNAGTFKVLSANTSSIWVENDNGTGEGPISLGSNYASMLVAFSAAGVQVGDALVIDSGFSPFSQQTFTVTGVQPNTIDFSTTVALPIETNIQTEVAIYSAAKRLFYIETDQKLNLTINGTQNIQVQPLINGSNVLPGIYLSSALAYSMVISNPGITDADVFIISAE